MKKSIFYSILFLVCLWLLNSCTTATKLYDKAKGKDIVKVAELARIDFPCTTTKADTLTMVDTVFNEVTVECPDSTIEYRVDSFETVTAVKVPVYVKVKVPETITKTVTVTKTIEDSAKIFVMQANITDKDKNITELESKVEHRGKVIKWLIFLLICLSIPYIIKGFKLIKKLSL